MRINQNLSALNAYRNLVNTDNALNKNLERLSSGLRINRAADDAAGLAISEKMRGQISGLGQAIRNAQDGISLIQTAEGALTESHNILQRIRMLAVQSANDTLTNDDRLEIQKEVDQLIAELDRIATTTQFNTKVLLDGSAGTKGKLVSSNGGLVSHISVTEETAVGTYTFTGSTLATASETNVLQTSVASGTDPATAAIGVASTIIINGEEFTFAETDTFGDVKNAIDAVLSETIEVTIGEWEDSGTDKVSLQISTTAVGSAAELEISGTEGIFTGISVTPGEDAKLPGADAYGTYQAAGNRITFTDGDLKGLAFVLTADGGFELEITRNDLVLQIGANENQTMSLNIGSMTTAALGVYGINLETSAAAGQAISIVDQAIYMVSSERAKLGAYQNRLEHTIANLGVSSENLTAAESRIRDVDMAEEMMAFTKNQILMQAGTAMLAQANIKPQSVLQLLA
ncbi:MAG: flagellin [Dethiobacteria bacterium]